MASDRLVYKTALSLVTIATSGLVRLVFSLLVGRVFDKVVLGHVNVIVSAAVFATLLCSPGMGQSVARQMATRGLGIADAEGRFLLVRSTVLHHALCLVAAAGVVLLVPTRVGIEQVLAVALTISYGCYTYYKAVLYGADLVRRYAVLELVWDGLFLASLVTVVAVGATSWLLAPMVLVYGGFSIGAHRVLLPGGRRRAAQAVRSASSGMTPVAARAPRPGAATVRRAGKGRTGPSATAGAASMPVVATASAAPAAENQFRDDRPWWRAVGGYALVTTLGTASSAGFLQLSLIFAARAGGEHGAGLFAAAMSLVTPAYLLPRAISVVLFPAMARAAGRADNGRVARQLEVGTDVLAAALLPFFAMAGVLATAVMTLMYGRSFSDGGATLIVMVWATWISVASVPAVNALSSDPGRGYLVPAGASLAGFLIGIVVWFACGTSIEAVAWGYLAGSLVQSAVPMVEAGRRHHYPRPWPIIRVAVAAAVSLAAALMVGRPPIAVTIGVAIVLAAGVTVIVLPEIRSLVRLGRHRAAL